MARAWVMVVGAAASGIAVWRRAAAAADRVREVAEGMRAGLEGSINLTWPESPMKDKPTARRPPAGLGIDVPTPRANRAAEPRPERSTGRLIGQNGPFHSSPKWSEHALATTFAHEAHRA